MCNRLGFYPSRRSHMTSALGTCGPVVCQAQTMDAQSDVDLGTFEPCLCHVPGQFCGVAACIILLGDLLSSECVGTLECNAWSCQWC